MLMSAFFVPLQIHDWFVTFSALMLTAVLFSLGGFVNAVFADKFDDISIIPSFVLTPLTYLGGVFYSLDLLPEFWRNVSYLNPIVYMVGTFRYGFYGATDAISVGGSLAALCGFTVVLAAFCLWLLRRGTGIRS
jgi:ABC-2 type transport system permease protein